MKYLRYSVFAVAALCISSIQAQSNTRESYQEFRKSLHKEYQDFRSRILQHYADFLEGEWHPYEPLDMPRRYDEPKPSKQPKKPESASRQPGSVTLPAPAMPKVPEIDIPQVKIPEVKTPQINTPTIKPHSPQTPQQDESAVASGEDTFDFYGMQISVPKIVFNILNTVSSAKDTPAQWKALDRGDARKAGELLSAKSEEMGLNGYLTYLLISDYVDYKFPSANDAARMGVVHYLLANMGYDVRLALSQSGMPLLMIPFEQTVYGSTYLQVDGKNYTIFAPKGKDVASAVNGNIYTCQLPKGEDLGKKMDLRIDALNLPYKPHHFQLSGGGLTISGETNENLYKLLYRYPQMPTQDFASSTLDPEVRKSIVEQVKQQLGDKPQKDAVNSLLAFFHKALPYATDEQRHGFEKPYFVEETLYYDKCDCEDRAIMFTWLLWNALGIENHLLAYPMHESAAVTLDSSVDGYNYSYGGETFWSADPTYIGAAVGDVMPQFKATTPKIDKEYK